VSAIDLEEVIAACERIDASDAAVALRLARAASASERQAWHLLAQAQQHAERLAGTLEFQRSVQAVASELLIRRELDGEAINALLTDSHSNHAQLEPVAKPSGSAHAARPLRR